jgi:hypothetical protein
VTLVAADTGDAAAPDTVVGTADGGDDGSDTLAIIALVVGALGLLAGGAALVRGRG